MKKYFFLLLLIPNAVHGQKDTINCYIQIQDIWNLDLNKSTVNVDFYLITQSKVSLEKKLNLLNGSILKIDTIVNSIQESFLTLRIESEIRTCFNFEKYPLDEQHITIKFEPYQYFSEIILVSRQEQNIFLDKVNLNGWKTNGIIFENQVSEYSIQEQGGEKTYLYSTAIFKIPISRKNKFMFLIKSFLPSIISILIIYIGFLLPPNQIEPRLNLSVGSLFLMVSNFIVTQQMLPEISEITIIEKINILSLVIIFLTILFFSLGYRYRKKLSNHTWYKINLIFVSTSISFYLLFFMIIC